jgi:hypothetical protein
MRSFIEDLVENRTRFLTVTTSVKYICSAILALLAVGGSGGSGGLVAAYAELAAIFCVSNLILMKWKKPGYIAGGILLLLFNAQMLVELFGGTFISPAMITNLDSLEDLGGKTFIYGTGVVLVLAISLLPSRVLDPKPFTHTGILSAVLALELVFTLVCGNTFSPLFAYHTLGRDLDRTHALAASIDEVDEDMTRHFWDYADYDFRKKPDDLPENPNVVIIFTEGLSQNIVTDERNIMPNVSRLEKESLFFENYYNHTFPTYRGLIGQLFSGYQLQNYDENTLVSVQESFRKKGYHTSIINTEPLNLNFATYLESLGFDDVVTNIEIDPEGTSSTLSDRQAFESLYDVIAGEHSAGQPFMTAIYTFGTHVSLDSPDEKYGDGSDRLLNKFYNYDFQFGQFMDRFLESEMADDTIIIFTADHCTYADSDFTSAFPDIRRAHTECDSMPLLIYYRGIEPETVDVNGRNSLDFAPTLLDYLDIHIGNYFLGFTLFADDQTSANMTSFDRIFSDSAVHASTEDASINGLSDVQKEIFESELHKYYVAKSQKRAN